MKIFKPLIRYTYLYLPIIMASFLIIGCEKEKGDLGEAAEASFNFTPVAGEANTFLLESTSENAFRYQWDLGDGQGLTSGPASYKAYFLKKGEYDVKLYAHGRGGFDVATQKITVENDDLSPILNSAEFKLLTAHSWKLDASSTAPIIVGTEGNPAEYYGGGALAECQKDDVYTFAFVDNDFKLSYNANGSTYNAENIEPRSTCAADRSYNNISFNYSTSVSGAGIASISIAQPVPTVFIGVTDVASNNYRIISISETEMVLRAGRPDQTIFQFRFIPN